MALENLKAQFKNVLPGDVGIMGDPIEHSLSPLMQNAAFDTWRKVFLEDGKPGARYHRFHVKADELKQAVQLAEEYQLQGLNVTVPHKVAAFRLMDTLEPLAKKMGAINTIHINGGKLIGYNTDGFGFERSLEEDLQFQCKDKKVLLLGAGGTGRVIAFQLHDLHIRTLYWWNRNPDRLDQVLADSGVYLPKVSPVKSDQKLADVVGEVDLVINATSVGMSKEDGLPAPGLEFNPTQSVYDVIYNRDTPLLKKARSAGAQTANGLGMLVFQGSKSFNIWTGAPAPIEVMRETLKKMTAKEII